MSKQSDSRNHAHCGARTSALVSGFGPALMAVLIAAVSSISLWADSTLQDGRDARLAIVAMQGDRDGVRALLKQNVDVNVAQGDGMTALHWAAYRNDVEMAKMLLT